MGAIVWILGLCCALSVVLQTVGADEHLPIVLRMQRTVASDINNVLNNPSISEQCKTRGITCGSCSSVMICSHEKQTVGSYECSSIDAQRPYCTGNGVCTNSMEEKCKTPSELCPPESTGSYYPVPGNCSESVYCAKDNTAVKTSAPSSSYYFNSIKQSWTLRKTAADCFQINCLSATMQNKFYVYKPNPQLYVYCATFGPMTFKCGANEEFNESKRACEFACKKEGNVGIPDGNGGFLKDRYYSCLATASGSFQLFELNCPVGLIFIDDDCKLAPLSPPS
uniref:BPTI/Kunitz inhibitor domain-containing protein n=1 Tax=Anopheles christyi TaxID=43041 RepID=A0A182KEL1_9DIPT